MSHPKFYEAWEIAEVVQLFKMDSNSRFVEMSAYEKLKAERDLALEALKFYAALTEIKPEYGYTARQAIAKIERK